MSEARLLDRLADAGLLRAEGDNHRTTRRWQAAMMRAALRRLEEGHDGEDLRVAVVVALLDFYDDELPNEELARLVEAMLPIEARELGLEP